MDYHHFAATRNRFSEGSLYWTATVLRPSDSPVADRVSSQTRNVYQIWLETKLVKRRRAVFSDGYQMSNMVRHAGRRPHTCASSRIDGSGPDRDEMMLMLLLPLLLLLLQQQHPATLDLETGPSGGRVREHTHDCDDCFWSMAGSTRLRSTSLSNVRINP